MSIGVGGLVSGLDTETIISQLMDIERRPILLLQKKEAADQAKISGLGSLKSALSSLQNSMSALKDADNFISLSATSGNTAVLTASASQDAVSGEYQVEVTTLAQAQQVRSSAFTSSDEVVGTGTLTIQVGTGTSFDIEIDSDHETLGGIATAINEAETDVAAGVVHDGNGNYYLTLVSQETGASNTISFTLADADGNNDDASGLSGLYTDPVAHTLTQTQAAENADLTVNGIAVARATNTIDDLIDGVTLELKQEDPGNPFTVTVARNTSSVTAKLQDFVEKYNSLMDVLNELQSYNPETGEAGLLQGDSTSRHIQSRLQRFLYTQVNGVAGAVNGLSRLGIEMGSNGKLSLDSSELTAALESHSADVVAFFTQETTGNEGIAVRLDNLLDSYVKSSTGILAAKEKGLQSSIEGIEDQIERIEFRLAKREDNLRHQFEALESLLADFQATSGALDRQLASLDNLNSSIYRKK